MGKPRKIEIDDRIPCNKNEEPLLPKCDNCEELWPAIITKALIKLFSYKFKTYTKRESIIGDIQIIYALTGFFAELVDMSNPSFDFKKYFGKVEAIRVAAAAGEKNCFDDKSDFKSFENAEKEGRDKKDEEAKENDDADGKSMSFIMCYNFNTVREMQGVQADKDLLRPNRLIPGTCKTNKVLPSVEIIKEGKEFIEENEEIKVNGNFNKKGINFFVYLVIYGFANIWMNLFFYFFVLR